jgi:ligand-binding SRPBCC domain-containing protein
VRIELETRIAAPADRCFDLSRSVDVHLRSTARTGERAVAGKQTGLMEFGDEVTWEARHFGRRRRLTVRITGYDRPRAFRDEVVGGALRRMAHDHTFEEADGVTTMRDAFEFSCGVGLVDRLLLLPHLRRLLLERNALIRELAESGD